MKEGLVIENNELLNAKLDDFYLGCTFEGCDFSKVKICDTHFEECTFERCNLSLTSFHCQLTDVRFVECKIVGTDFTGLNKFSTINAFSKCNLSYATFVGARIVASRFENCTIADCDFTNTDLNKTVFENCDLTGSTFEQTNLEKCDFETSSGFTINPNSNRLQKTIFSNSELHGLLSHLNIIIK